MTQPVRALRIGAPPAKHPGARAAGAVLGHPIALAVLVESALVTIWLRMFPTVGTDLSAQVTRGMFARMHPGSAYFFNWYAGISPAGYALLSPYLLSVVGAWLLLAGSAIGCAGLFAMAFVRYRLPHPRVISVWAALAVTQGVIAGRATYTAGLMFGIAALLVLPSRKPANTSAGESHQDSDKADPRPVAHPGMQRCRLPAAGCCAFVSSAISPVAGVFVGLAAAALLLSGRRRDGVLIGVAAALPLLVELIWFASPGAEPFRWMLVLQPLLTTGLIIVLIPAGRYRALRAGAWLYLLGLIAAVVLTTPIGSNVIRLSEPLLGPLLIALAVGLPRTAKRAVAVVVLFTAFWQCLQPVHDLRNGHPTVATPATTALRTELRTVHADRTRVEAVPLYGHWESEQLAMTVPLARGWERQVDTARNPIFYRTALTAAGYRSWLRANAVGYVALSSGPLDYSATAEAALIRAGLPYLHRIWARGPWTLYAVADPAPMATAPGSVLASTPASLTLAMSRPGVTVIRLAFSRWLRVSGGASLTPDGSDVALRVARAGDYVITAPLGGL